MDLRQAVMKYHVQYYISRATFMGDQYLDPLCEENCNELSQNKWISLYYRSSKATPLFFPILIEPDNLP